MDSRVMRHYSDRAVPVVMGLACYTSDQELHSAVSAGVATRQDMLFMDLALWDAVDGELDVLDANIPATWESAL